MGKKAKKESAPPVDPSEFDNMPEAELFLAIEELESKVEKAKADRNYVQVERDTIQMFYDITKKEVSQCELDVLMRDKEIEQLEGNHRVEVRVYAQKVKHFEYEHKNNMKRSSAEGAQNEEMEGSEHDSRVEALKEGKKGLKLELLEVQLNNEEKVQQIKDTHKKNLSKLQETFDENLEALSNKYASNLEDLRADLELQRKVEIHEIEERKNMHINDLMKNHAKAFGQIKTYYNDITHDNLKLIKSLKDEVSGMKKKAAANQQLMYEIAQENKRLSEPLAVAVKEVDELRYQLKDFEKVKTSFKYATARFQVRRVELENLKVKHKQLERQYKDTEFERDKIYDTFEDTIGDVQRKSEFKNVVLEQRLGKMQASHEEKISQIRGLCTQVDQVMLQKVTQQLDQAINQRNATLQKMEYHLAYVHKTFNDTARTLAEKLQEFGIPEQDAAVAKVISSQTSSMPAGLVTK